MDYTQDQIERLEALIERATQSILKPKAESMRAYEQEARAIYHEHNEEQGYPSGYTFTEDHELERLDELDNNDDPSFEVEYREILFRFLSLVRQHVQLWYSEMVGPSSDSCRI